MLAAPVIKYLLDLIFKLVSLEILMLLYCDVAFQIHPAAAHV